MDPFEGVTLEQYLAHRTRSFGQQNGQRMDYPLWQAAVRSGENAYNIRHRYEPSAIVADEPGWCFQRYGRTCTLIEPYMEPLVHIWIGGEHEDGYDPDFCIYNDVVVTHLDGTVEIRGYPRDVFPPTDFHTATRIGDSHNLGSIYIIGRLGYANDRIPGTTPVYRLDIEDDYRIRQVDVHGEEPSWLHDHEALYLPWLNGIAVWGGSILSLAGVRHRNEQAWLLDLHASRWTKVDALNMRQER